MTVNFGSPIASKYVSGLLYNRLVQKSQVVKIHKELVATYRDFLLPIFEKYFESDINATQEKSGGEYATSLVSEADLAINKVLTEKLVQLVPEANIISEESSDDTVGKHTFIVDPIDGTHTFVRNLDDWGTPIVLCENGEVIYSIIFFPRSKTEYYYAIKGLGAFDSNNNKVVLQKFFDFKPEFVASPSSRKIGRALIDYSKGKMLSFRAFGSCVYAVYTLLRGGSDFIVFDDLNIWDILGCVFIAKEAGFSFYWISDSPKLDGSVNLKKAKYTLMIYKPDFDKVLLKEIQTIIHKSVN